LDIHRTWVGLVPCKSLPLTKCSIDRTAGSPTSAMVCLSLLGRIISTASLGERWRGYDSTQEG